MKNSFYSILDLTSPYEITTMTPNFLSFPSRESLAEILANDVAAKLHEAIVENDIATLVVSGGSTPAPFFKALAAKPLAWDKITILVADERWVEVTSDDSNEKLVRQYFGSTAAHILSLAPAYTSEPLQEGCARIAQQLDTLPSPLDVVILGMGEDGHTASLFPHHSALKDGLNPKYKGLCLPITDSPKPPANRITLTARMLLDCEYLILHITGDAKKAVFENALQSDAATMPIAAFLTQPYTPLTTYWAA
jgi:6-phosphogluconolactonase